MFSIKENKVFFTILLVGFCAMFTLFVTILTDDLKVPQRIVTMKIDVKNHVNICVPEDEEF